MKHFSPADDVAISATQGTKEIRYSDLHQVSAKVSHSFKPNQESKADLPSGMTVKAATVDLAGQRFGRLVAVSVIGKNRQNSLVWLCICDCGKTTQRSSASLKKAKGVVSCGCYLKEKSKERLAAVKPWNKGKTYSNKSDDAEYTNKKAWSAAVIRKYGPKCQICGWDKARCDVHHIVPRSNGGKNTVNNGMVLCPNCHRVEHESKTGANV